MDNEDIFKLITEFSAETHGRTDYGSDLIFIKGRDALEFAPFKFLSKKIDEINDIKDILALGHVYASYDFVDTSVFKKWYEEQFARKLTMKVAKSIQILRKPDLTRVFNVLKDIDIAHQKLREEHILLNGKNLPVQVGEWFSKSIFGLKQVKSSSQRGFDFYLENKRVEVKVIWKESFSPKGVKIKKSLMDLSDFCILIYLTKSFLIRDICFLDSKFVLRKFAGKGHTLFLKENEVDGYFFSKSTKHIDKVSDKSAIMTFASPNFALKLDGRI